VVRKKGNWKRIGVIFFGVFIVAALVSSSSELLVKGASLGVAWVLLFLVIIIGIIFDVIGTAAAAATEAPHHAAAANKVKGAKQAVFIVRHADAVANFSNDIVGDICGTISGAMAASIVLNLLQSYPSLRIYQIVINTVMLAFVASITVTGKAIGKRFAIQEANRIVGAVGKLMAVIEDFTGWRFTERKKRGDRKSHGLARKNK